MLPLLLLLLLLVPVVVVLPLLLLLVLVLLLLLLLLLAPSNVSHEQLSGVGLQLRPRMLAAAGGYGFQL